MEEVRYERLRPAQIVKLRQAFPLAYLPLGVIEWHGLQNPLGLDGLKVHGVATRAAQRGGGLVFPVPWYGAHRESHLLEFSAPSREAVAEALELSPGSFSPGYMGGETVSSQAFLYQQLLFHIYHEIKSYGFEAIFVLSGHGPLKPYAVLTSQIFERQTGVKMEVVWAAELVAGYQEDHAGRFETGVMMALEPDLVDLGTLTEEPSTLTGIGGRDPREGSSELGEAFLELAVDELVSRSQRLLQRPPSDGAMKIE